MVASIRERVIVQSDGMIEIRKTGLLPGTRADVFIVPESPGTAPQPSETEDSPIKSPPIQNGETFLAQIVNSGSILPSPSEPHESPLDWEAALDIPPTRPHDYISIQIVEGGYRDPMQLDLGD